MKNKTMKSFINKDKLQDIAVKVPYVFILLLMLIISPLGVYLFVFRVINNKRNMYNKGKTLISIGLFVLFLVGIGIYSKVKEIIVLYDSGMSLDMISFIPENPILYVVGIVIVGSYIYGGKQLLKIARAEQVYTYRINLDHIVSLRDLSNELGITIKDVKDNIKLLQNGGYLIPLQIDNKKNKIIYTHEKDNTKVVVRKKHDNRKVQCPKCGTLVTLKLDEYIECDFCGHGMIDE